MTIGVVSFELSVPVALYGISEEAQQHGYATPLVTRASLDRDNMRAAFESINSDTVDGVIVLAPLLDAITVLEGLDVGVPWSHSSKDRSRVRPAFPLMKCEEHRC